MMNQFYIDIVYITMSECNYDNQSLLDQRQKVIQNVVRVTSSEYSMNLASNIVYDSNNTNLGLADRSSNVGTQKQQVKKGVNVKHDSYARYLAKKKGLKVLRFPVFFGERLYGSSHWNIDWRSKIKFIRRTIDFSFELKKKYD